MINCVVIIPALNPTHGLIDYVIRLLKSGIAHIIIVNDGSNPESLPIFTELDTLATCTVLTHDINQGKGRALKTAFNYISEHFQDINGVVTADADGQHSVEDVVKIARLIALNENNMILGIRDFNHPDVPPKSIFGNKLTRFIFYRFFKVKIEDTQTGLRGIASHNLPWLVLVKGERYEYEINMLIHAISRKVSLHEVMIETIYFDNNSGSYYKAVRDSLLILNRIVSGFFQKRLLYKSKNTEQFGDN